MEYAIQLLLPMALGFWGGAQINQLGTHWGWPTSDLWTVAGGIGGFFLGLATMVRRLMAQHPPITHWNDDPTSEAAESHTPHEPNP